MGTRKNGDENVNSLYSTYPTHRLTSKFFSVSNCTWNGPFILITSVRVTTAPRPHPEPTSASRHGHAKPTAPCCWGHCKTSSLPGREVGRPVPRTAGREPRQVARVHSRGQERVETKVGASELRVDAGRIRGEKGVGSFKPISVLGGALRLQKGGERGGAG